jgi:hypothetical protein
MSFLVEPLSVSHSFHFRVKNICSGRSVDMLPNFDQRGFFEKLNISNQISALLMMLIVNIHVLPSFTKRKKYMSFTLFYRKLMES